MDDERDEILNAIAPGRVFEREKDEGTFVTRLFSAIARGEDVAVDDRRPSPFGVRALYDGDADFIFAEQTRRKHDALTTATVKGRTAAVAGAVVGAIVEDQVGGRIGAVEDRVALVKDIMALLKGRRKPSRKKKGTK